jgi:arylsulfatase A-like enzyme
MAKRPNILFIMTDDHAAHAMSCYGSRINKTPNLDRIADEGMRFDNCFCTNSICTPSRAAILAGTYNHINRVTTLTTMMDNRLQTFPKMMQADGYQTAIVGKWHLGQGPDHWPTGFDYWSVLPGQGLYHDPVMVEMEEEKVFPGYVTDIVTDKALGWLTERNKEKPFMLMLHHKAPHRSWEPDDKHASMYEDEEIPYPETFNDTYENRSAAAAAATMRVDRHFNSIDLKIQVPDGLKRNDQLSIPDDLSDYEIVDLDGTVFTFKDHDELKKWKYQRYIKDYLRCIASVDDNVGRVLDFLDTEGLADDTIVVYTSDQGFFLGDHGWYDKRFMYEESLRMPFVIKYPKAISAGSVNSDIVLNVDFAQTFLDYAGIAEDDSMQGRSFRQLLGGSTPDDWREGMYYRYWMHKAHHNVYAHYGIRTLKYKLIYFYNDGLDQEGTIDEIYEPEWELFDLEKDPNEISNVYADPAYADVVKDLTVELHRLQSEVGDERYPKDI